MRSTFSQLESLIATFAAQRVSLATSSSDSNMIQLTDQVTSSTVDPWPIIVQHLAYKPDMNTSMSSPALDRLPRRQYSDGCLVVRGSTGQSTSFAGTRRSTIANKEDLLALQLPPVDEDVLRQALAFTASHPGWNLTRIASHFNIPRVQLLQALHKASSQ